MTASTVTAPLGAPDISTAAAVRAAPRGREQTRARYPDASGYVERNGVNVFWERYGDGPRTVLLMPTWQAIHSRMWKAQIHDLARRARVVTFDPRGNGQTDRPATPRGYDRREFAEDAVAILDHLGIERALVVTWCDEGQALTLAAEHPDRVAGLVVVSANPIGGYPPSRIPYPFHEPLPTDEGWAKENSHYWRRDWLGYVEFFFAEMFPERHATKQHRGRGRAGARTTDAETCSSRTPPRSSTPTAPVPSVAGSAARAWWSRASTTASPTRPARPRWPG